jgi:4-hydroxymandelate oxidase
MRSSSPQPQLEQAGRRLSLRELEVEARKLLDPVVYDFVAGGADDETTLRANETAFSRIGLLPRILRGKERPELAVTLLNCRAALPVVIAPTAFHCLAHSEGERATSRAAAAAGTIMIASMASTVAIGEVAAAVRETTGGASPNLWFQLYIQPDYGFTEAIIRRAEAAGCAALVVSVDSPVFGRRERDVRNGFIDLPPGMCCENLREPTNSGEPGRVRPIVFRPELSWDDIAWLRKTTTLKIVLKGVTHPEDARLAIDAGVDALMVSNHGGRQLDTVPASVELLPAIADAVNGSLPLLLDGGIRRGTDVVKAIALGARAVAVGRPVFWGLALGGEGGVAQMLEILRTELERALILCGCGSLSDVTRDLVRCQPLSETETVC